MQKTSCYFPGQLKDEQELPPPQKPSRPYRGKAETAAALLCTEQWDGNAWHKRGKKKRTRNGLLRRSRIVSDGSYEI